jgi:hypothetical protein
MSRMVVTERHVGTGHGLDDTMTGAPSDEDPTIVLL